MNTIIGKVFGGWQGVEGLWGEQKKNKRNDAGEEMVEKEPFLFVERERERERKRAGTLFSRRRIKEKQEKCV